MGILDIPVFSMPSISIKVSDGTRVSPGPVTVGYCDGVDLLSDVYLLAQGQSQVMLLHPPRGYLFLFVSPKWLNHECSPRGFSPCLEDVHHLTLGPARSRANKSQRYGLARRGTICSSKGERGRAFREAWRAACGGHTELGVGGEADMLGWPCREPCLGTQPVTGLASTRGHRTPL